MEFAVYVGELLIRSGCGWSSARRILTVSLPAIIIFKISSRSTFLSFCRYIRDTKEKDL